MGFAKKRIFIMHFCTDENRKTVGSILCKRRSQIAAAGRAAVALAGEEAKL
jgi:hypothetical protein